MLNAMAQLQFLIEYMPYSYFLLNWLKFNYIVSVVGEKEKENRTVNVRTRDNKVHGEFAIDDVLSKFKKLAAERILKSEEEFGSV